MLARGEDTSMMTPGLRALITPATSDIIKARLNNLESFAFLRCDEAGGRVLERMGAQISQSCYYKMVAGTETRYYVFRLTSEDKVADFRSFRE